MASIADFINTSTNNSLTSVLQQLPLLRQRAMENKLANLRLQALQEQMAQREAILPLTVAVQKATLGEKVAQGGYYDARRRAMPITALDAPDEQSYVATLMQAGVPYKWLATHLPDQWGNYPGLKGTIASKQAPDGSAPLLANLPATVNFTGSQGGVSAPDPTNQANGDITSQMTRNPLDPTGAASRQFKQTTSDIQQKSLGRIKTARDLLNNLYKYTQAMRPYFGIGGSVRLLADKIGALGGKSSPSYNAYRAFMQALPTFVNEWRAAFTGPNTTTESKTLEKALITPNKFFSMGPETADYLFGQLYTNLSDQEGELSKNLAQQAGTPVTMPRALQLRLAAQSSLYPSSENIENMTFKNRDEAKKWYMTTRRR